MIQFHDGWEDDEAENEDDHPAGDDGDDDLDECPRCGRSIYDDSERCPRCGQYLSREEAVERRPWWVVLGAVACLGMVVYWIVHR